MKNNYKSLEKSLGYRFKKTELLEHALTHPSYRHESEMPRDNQRLEYLGDAVLDLCCAQTLFHEFPDFQEGELTKIRSSLTNTQSLAQLAQHIGLGDYLFLGKGELKSGGVTRESNLADALEAVIGAAFLDSGLKAGTKIFSNLFSELIDNLSLDGSDNPKGSLQELTQKTYQENPVYTIESETGPPHNKLYVANVSVSNKTLGHGRGSSKRSAEANAARDALENEGLSE